MNQKWVVRVLGLLVAVVYFSTNVLLVHAEENNFWGDRRRSRQGIVSNETFRESREAGTAPVYSGSVPDVFSNAAFLSIAQSVRPYGEIRFVRESSNPSAPVILHLQDVHGNLEAQRNMAEMVLALVRDRRVQLVGLEGATGAFATDEFRPYPNRDAVRRGANLFLKKDLIGGPEFAALVTDTPITLWGIEDPSLYQANITAVKASLAFRAPAEEFLHVLSRTLTALKKQIYTKELQAFDLNRSLYDQGQRDVGQFLEALAQWGGFNNETIGAVAPNAGRLLSAMKQEKQINFHAVERERADLVGKLGDDGSPADLQQIVEQSVELREGKISAAAYYTFLRDAGQRNGVSLEGYPALTSYLHYLEVCESIERDTLLSELVKLENSVQDTLAQTTEQRTLVQLARDERVLQNLLRNECTPDDWDSYQNRRQDILNLAARVNKLDRGVALLGAEELETLVAPFEAFFAFAEKRNGALSHRVLNKMKEDHQATAILVAGGFHTEGLVQILGEAGASVAVITPKVGKIDSTHRYVDEFAQDAPPLEQIFSGESIALKKPCGLSIENPASVSEALHLAIAGLTVYIRCQSSEAMGNMSALILQSIRKFANSLPRGPELVAIGDTGLTLEQDGKEINVQAKRDQIILMAADKDERESSTQRGRARNAEEKKETSSVLARIKQVLLDFLLEERNPDPHTNPPLNPNAELYESIVAAFQDGTLDSIKHSVAQLGLNIVDVKTNFDRIVREVSLRNISQRKKTPLNTPYPNDADFDCTTLEGLPNVLVLIPKKQSNRQRDFEGSIKTYNGIKENLGELFTRMTLVEELGRYSNDQNVDNIPYVILLEKIPLLSEKTEWLPQDFRKFGDHQKTEILKTISARGKNISDFQHTLEIRGFHFTESGREFLRIVGVSPSNRLVLVSLQKGNSTPTRGKRVHDVFEEEIKAEQTKWLENHDNKKSPMPQSLSKKVVSVLVPIIGMTAFGYGMTELALLLAGADPTGITLGMIMAPLIMPATMAHMGGNVNTVYKQTDVPEDFVSPPNAPTNLLWGTIVSRIDTQFHSSGAEGINNVFYLSLNRMFEADEYFDSVPEGDKARMATAAAGICKELKTSPGNYSTLMDYLKVASLFDVLAIPSDFAWVQNHLHKQQYIFGPIRETLTLDPQDISARHEKYRTFITPAVNPSSNVIAPTLSTDSIIPTIPRVTPLRVANRDWTKIDHNLLGEDVRTEEFALRMRYEPALNSNGQISSRDVAAFKSFLLRALQQAKNPTAKDVPAFKVGESWINVAHWNNLSENKVRFWVLAEAWLASATLIEKIGPLYRGLVEEEKLLFKNKGQSPRERLVRAAQLAGLLRARGSSIFSMNGTIPVSGQNEMDVSFLINAIGTTGDKWQELSGAVVGAFNVALESAARVSLWRGAASSFLVPNESIHSTPGTDFDTGSVIVFDMDALASNTASERKAAFGALAGLLSLPSDYLQRYVVLCASRLVNKEKILAALAGRLDGDKIARIHALRLVSPEDKVPGLFVQNSAGHTEIHVGKLLESTVYFPQGKPLCAQFWTLDVNRVIAGSKDVVVKNIFLLHLVIEDFLKQQFVSIFA